MLEEVLQQLGYEKEKNRRYVKYDVAEGKKRPRSVIYQYGCNRARNHGELQKQITVAMLEKERLELIKCYDYACENDAKFFFVGEYGDATWQDDFVRDRFLKKYIYSIEFVTMPESGNFDMSQIIDEIRDEIGDENRDKAEKNIIRKHVKKKNNFYVVLIKVKENEDDENFVTDYLKYYLEAADSRTYSQSVCKSVRVEFIEKAEHVPKKTELPYNLLIYGAPGTGKSRYIDDKINEIADEYDMKVVSDDNNETDIEIAKANKYATFRNQFVKRVTFYEDYGYENFIGCYKPAPMDEDERVIVYKYEAGPFIETYIRAKNNPDKPYFLVIEELNRAKAASAFGDMFQLLDRKDGISEYGITLEPALRKYLAEHLDNGTETENGVMKLPDNMYIWATMNSADQGVFSIDSAFKRRWSFLYKDINAHKQTGIQTICLVKKVENGKKIVGEISWHEFRMAINNVILSTGRDEDRCIGPWFFSDDELQKIKKYTATNKFVENENGELIRTDEMENPLVDKLLAYLRQDVFRMDSEALFTDDQGRCNMSTIRKKVEEDQPITEILKIDLPDALWIEIKEDGSIDENNNQ